MRRPNGVLLIAAITAVTLALRTLSGASSIGEAGLAVVSVSSNGMPGDFLSSSPSISGDARYVAFSSDATTFVENDTNARDIFLHDRQAGTTMLISVATDGIQANRAATNPAVSGDGRYVAFDSEADNLVPNDDPVSKDVFIRDTEAGTTELISVSSDGAPGNGDSELPSISADGRYVAFTSIADNLVDGDDNQARDVFIRDRQLGTTELVSVSSDGVQGNLTSGHLQAGKSNMSADGRFIVFGSFADNLVEDDNNQADDAFIRDRLSGTTERVSVSSDVLEGNGHSMHPDVSDDGRYVVFDSVASNLFPGDTLAHHVLVHDRDDGTTIPVSLAHDGGEPDDASYLPAISGNGAWVAFTSEAGNLVEDDLNERIDVFLYSMQAGELELVSVAESGDHGDFDSNNPSLSTGGVLAFQSHASNLLPGDDNGVTDVFVLGKRLREPTATPPPTATTTPELPTPYPTAVPAADVGDTDCSGSVNAIDAALVLQFVASFLEALPCQSAADANQNGQINAIDAALILQLTAGFFNSLPP